MSYDLDALRAAVDGIPQSAWSEPSTFASTKVHEGYRRIQLITEGKASFPDYTGMLAFVDDYAPISRSWLAWIDPGGFILPHMDAGPWKERWHIPVYSGGLFNSERHTEPFQVSHWDPHWVDNDSDHPRVHLIIDRVAAAGPDRHHDFKLMEETWPATAALLRSRSLSMELRSS